MKPLSIASAVCLALCFLASACAGGPSEVAVTGEWEERDERAILLSLWSFSTDGSFTYDVLPRISQEEAEHLSGTYRVVEGPALLTNGIDPGAREQRQTQSLIYQRGDVLAPDAFLAEARGADITGKWRNSSLREVRDIGGQPRWQERQTQTLELGFDGKLRLMQSVGDGPEQEYGGSYEVLGDGRYRFTLNLEEVSIGFTLRLVNGEALVPRVYRRKAQ